MKRNLRYLLIISITVFLMAIISVCSFAEGVPELKFTPREGGKFIYSNNREFIFRSDLADNSNREARYIMSNENMTADKYTLFASHVNHTEKRGYWGELQGRGYDIELDVLFLAKEDCTVKFTALGFEVPDNIKYYSGGDEFTTESEWGCFTAWASYLGQEINTLDSGVKYEPVPFEPRTVSLAAGEKMWLSEIIPNYREVPLWRPVHIMTDFEILGGTADINVAAVRSTGRLGDRSRVTGNVAFGSFIPEYQIKGVANSQNQVDAYLEFDVSNNVSDGEKLPVKIVNRFAPEGDIVTTWYTHLNPAADIWNKNNVAESSMLGFEYPDESKNKYYGKGVKQAERDGVWHFDITHSSLTEYVKGAGKSKNKFEPNFEVNTKTPEEYCNVLGNYGVLNNYHVTVKNSGYSDRWLSYTLNTAANNLIILKDENGNTVKGYPLTKGTEYVKENDRLINIKLPAGQTVKFTLTVILTTNHVGGMENSFVLRDVATPINTYKSNYDKNVKDRKFTGREQIRWDGERLLVSADGENWEEKPLTEEVRKIFNDVWNEMRITWTGSDYIVNNEQYSGIPYYLVRDLYRDVYCLDENFKLKWKNNFGNYTTESMGGLGRYYIKAGSLYTSTDGVNWVLTGQNMNLPVYNYGRFMATMKKDGVYLSENGTDFYRVIYEGETPKYIDSLGDLYYYISGSTLYVSHQGAYFTAIDCGEKVNKISRTSKGIVINGKKILPVPEENKQAEPIKFGGQYIALKNPSVNFGGANAIPLRAFVSLAGGELFFDENKRCAEVIINGHKGIFGLDGGCEIDGNRYENLCFVKDGRIYFAADSVKYFEETQN